MTVTFIVYLSLKRSKLTCRCRGMRQRHERRFHTCFVTRRRIHVTEFGVRRHGAAAGAHGNEMAVAAVLVRRQRVEARGGGNTPALLPSVDVADRLRRFAGEPRARVERPV